jgi:regulator of sigma E protease
LNPATLLPIVGSVAALILIHECGHLVAAKLSGLPVTTATFGLGPKVAEWVWRGTTYQIHVFPFGGHVLLGTSADPDAADHFAAPKLSAFFAGGMIANLITGGAALTVALFFMTFMTHQTAPRSGPPVPPSAVAQRILQAGSMAFRRGPRLTVTAATHTWSGFTAAADAPSAQDVPSATSVPPPAGTTPTVSKWLGVALLFGFLSVKIGLLNALPIPFPGLDGGNLAFLAYEAAVGRPLAPETRTNANMAGIMLVTLLVTLFGARAAIGVRKRHQRQEPAREDTLQRTGPNRF